MASNPGKKLFCTVRWETGKPYFCVSHMKVLQNLESVEEHFGDRSLFGNWKKQRDKDIRAKRANNFPQNFDPPISVKLSMDMLVKEADSSGQNA